MDNPSGRGAATIRWVSDAPLTGVRGMGRINENGEINRVSQNVSFDATVCAGEPCAPDGRSLENNVQAGIEKPVDLSAMGILPLLRQMKQITDLLY
ncbi:hypothetical protein HDU82_003714, partial [Entophlyctis luteolus]